MPSFKLKFYHYTANGRRAHASIIVQAENIIEAHTVAANHLNPIIYKYIVYSCDKIGDHTPATIINLAG